MSGAGRQERPGSPAGTASGPWARGPGRARHRAAASWLRMACAALLSCAAAGPAAGAPGAWKGPGLVSMDGTARIAAPGAFERWEGAPCDGATDPVCELPKATSPAAMPTASFRPFAVAGAKPPAFGLGHPEAAGSHFRVRSRDAPGTGPSPVPGLGGLGPGAEPVRLEAPARLLPWGFGGHVTEACGVAGCAAAPGGERTLAQADSTATDRFTAPNAGNGDFFGFPLALSADGATLAVGAHLEDSAATGAFVPGGAGYQAALDSDGAEDSGAVYVHRRSTDGRWALEAFVKAPVAGAGDYFGRSLALSADGATLAVGAAYEYSSATGAFAPGDDGYRAALESDGAGNSGAAYVHRRSAAGRWALEAYVKAPNGGGGGGFGAALALSADGATLAAGAYGESGAATGAFAPGDAGYRAALDSDGGAGSGAVYVHRRSDGGRWALEAYVKAPNARAGDSFGIALALSADGATLAVGAHQEDSASTGTFAPGDDGYQAALDSDGVVHSSGATYVHRRSAGGRWALEAFVKAPVASELDFFGSELALSVDGSTLAVGASYEDSTATGAFSPGDDGYQAALESDGAYSNSGAAYVYRRSATGRWALEAFVKAPNAADDDSFGSALALSADGSSLAVGAPGEDSVATGSTATGAGYRRAALESGDVEGEGYVDNEAGAFYAYRRSAAGRWTVGNSVKAPNAGVSDSFGAALALSADGSALAVGAPGEGGSARLGPGGGGSSDSASAAPRAGAVYLY